MLKPFWMWVVSRIPGEVMIAGIEEMLASRFGKDGVVDVLGGTNLEQYSKQCGFGLYVVKAAVEPLVQGNWAAGTMKAITMAEQKRTENKQKGTRKEQKEPKKKDEYAWVHGVVGDTLPLCCFGHPGDDHDCAEQLDGIDDNNPCKVLVDSVNWLHEKFGIATHQGGFSSCQFNEVVACEYQNEFDQYIPWHADSCIHGDKSMEWMNVYPHDECIHGGQRHQHQYQHEQ